MENSKQETQKIVIGGTYNHFKGGKYFVLDIAKHTETNEELVIYKRFENLYCIGTPTFARPLDMFLEWIERDEYSGFRMTLESNDA